MELVFVGVTASANSSRDRIQAFLIELCFLLLTSSSGADLCITYPGYCRRNFNAAGMEGLEDLLQNFSLSSKELGGANPGQEDIRKVILNCQRSLIGKVIGGKMVNYVGMKNFVNQEGNEEFNAEMLEINQANNREEKGKDSCLELDIIGGLAIP
ncbi:hypothetical protein ACH5RR_037991 [Cinchona calisaya]|uniref:Uncharacterized protein n=1 Tax=Cinchona calisaya TaxID=153742 RepID=A0ABD2YAT1_9GENT